jgi:hypothetical protein
MCLRSRVTSSGGIGTRRTAFFGPPLDFRLTSWENGRSGIFVDRRLDAKGLVAEDVLKRRSPGTPHLMGAPSGRNHPHREAALGLHTHACATQRNAFAVHRRVSTAPEQPFVYERLSWKAALMLGAILIVSGPTVVTPILHAARPGARLTRILGYESTTIDPIGAIIAVVVFEERALASGRRSQRQRGHGSGIL